MKRENSTKAKMYFDLARKSMPDNDEILHNIELLNTK